MLSDLKELSAFRYQEAQKSCQIGASAGGASEDAALQVIIVGLYRAPTRSTFFKNMALINCGFCLVQFDYIFSPIILLA